jgi:hypothetical protein
MKRETKYHVEMRHNQSFLIVWIATQVVQPFIIKRFQFKR